MLEAGLGLPVEDLRFFFKVARADMELQSESHIIEPAFRLSRCH